MEPLTIAVDSDTLTTMIESNRLGLYQVVARQKVDGTTSEYDLIFMFNEEGPYSARFDSSDPEAPFGDDDEVVCQSVMKNEAGTWVSVN